MRRWLTVGLLLEGSLAGAVVGQEADLPHALPRQGATLTYANQWIDAWDVTWTLDSPTPMHRHAFDYFGVELTASRTLLTALDGGTRTVSLERGQTWFLRKGVTHAETGLTGDPQRRAIIVELKDAVPGPMANSTQLPLGPVDSAVEAVIDNERVTMWDLTWSAGDTAQMRYYDRPVLIMFVTDAEIEWFEDDGIAETKSFQAGHVHFLQAGRARSRRTLGNDVRAIVVVLKDGS